MDSLPGLLNRFFAEADGDRVVIQAPSGEWLKAGVGYTYGSLMLGWDSDDGKRRVEFTTARLDQACVMPDGIALLGFIGAGRVTVLLSSDEFSREDRVKLWPKRNG